MKQHQNFEDSFWIQWQLLYVAYVSFVVILELMMDTAVCEICLQKKCCFFLVRVCVCVCITGTKLFSQFVANLWARLNKF